MPICRYCDAVFVDEYRVKYCSLECQFLSKVPVDCGRDDCWLWVGGTTKAGYGVMNSKGRMILAHRFSCELFNGLPDGLYACHRCDMPSCVNPSHLFAGTATDNARDMVAKGRWNADPIMRKEAARRAAVSRESNELYRKQALESELMNVRHVAQQIALQHPELRAHAQELLSSARNIMELAL